jgi:tetratricopeptide (TPR) repeat protein
MKTYITIFITLLFISCNSNESDKSLELRTINHYKSQKQNGDVNRLNAIDSLIFLYKHEDADLYIDRISVLSNNEDLEEIIYSYTRALELGYDKEIIYFNRGICFAKILNDSMAYKDLVSYKEIYPDKKIGYLLLKYNIQNNLMDKNGAINSLDSIIHLKPTVPYYYYDKAILELELGDTLSYCKTMKRSIELGILDHVDQSVESLMKLCN